MLSRRILLVLGMWMLVFVPVSTQQDTTTITLGLTPFEAEQLRNAIADFEADNPDIRLHVVESANSIDRSSMERYYDSLQARVTQADIVIANRLTLEREGTLAGYFLDLSPLADNGDGDIPAPVWDSFRWDGGMWALTTHYNLISLPSCSL